MTRLVAVLGFSTWRGDELHPIARDRLRAAEAEAEGAAAVLFSGWSRRRHRLPEAELMRAAWAGPPDVPLLADRDARSTAGNARSVAAAVERVGATEVVLVTSSWHARRARHLVRDTLPAHVALRVATPGRSRPARLVARELALYLLRRTSAPTARALRRRVRAPRRSPRA